MFVRSHHALAARIWLVGISSEFAYELACLNSASLHRCGALVAGSLGSLGDGQTVQVLP